MKRLLSYGLAVCLFFPSTLPLHADQRKQVEQRLKATYKEGTVVRLENPSAADKPMRLDVSEEVARTIDAETAAYLRIEELKLKKAELEFRARRVHFFQDSEKRLRSALGPLWKYRLRWNEHEIGAEHLEQAIRQVLIPAQSKAEESDHIWPPDLPAGHGTVDKPSGASVEVSPGVYALGEGMTLPKCQYCPPPEYTPGAPLPNVHGLAVVIVLISETGRVLGVRIGRSAGYGFDEATVATVYTWRFTPALLHGKPVRVVMTVETRFHIY